jgi:hypothetical protein
MFRHCGVFYISNVIIPQITTLDDSHISLKGTSPFRHIEVPVPRQYTCSIIVAHTTNLTPERHIEVPVPRQYSKQSCICCYSLIHFFFVCTFFLVDFNTNLTVYVIIPQITTLDDSHISLKGTSPFLTFLQSIQVFGSTIIMKIKIENATLSD